MPVSRQQPIGPLYAKVKRHLLEKILQGSLGPGDRIPSENELVKTFEVSRMTANRALRELTDEGYLVRVAGVGTFVAHFKAKGPLVEIRNIADEVRQRGHDYSSEVILNAKENAGSQIARYLELEIKTPVFHTVLVHKEQGTPIQLEERYVSPDVVPIYGDADFRQTTPSEVLLKAAPLQEAEHTSCPLGESGISCIWTPRNRALSSRGAPGPTGGPRRWQFFTIRATALNCQGISSPDDGHEIYYVLPCIYMYRRSNENAKQTHHTRAAGQGAPGKIMGRGGPVANADE